MCSTKDDIFRLYQKFRDLNTVASILRREGTHISLSKIREIVISKFLEIADDIRNDVASGMTLDELAEKYSASPKMMRAVLKRLGVSIIPGDHKPNHRDTIENLAKLLRAAGLRVLSTSGYIPDLIVFSGNKVIAIEFENLPPDKASKSVERRKKTERAIMSGYDDVIVITWLELLLLDQEVEKIKKELDSQNI